MWDLHARERASGGVQGCCLPRLLTVLFLAVVFTCFSKVTEENGEQMPCYFVTVSLQEVGGVETKNWTVPRRLSEFQNLHRRLSEVRTLVAQA